MVTAIHQGVPGILGICGGAASCGTCHVYFDDSQVDAVADKDELEEEILAEAAATVRDDSRLGCQLILNTSFDGCYIRTPERQE